jgi:hypothetical protein
VWACFIIARMRTTSSWTNFRSPMDKGCAHPLHWSERESEKEGGRESEKEGGRERERESICYLKGMTGALAPFSHLVFDSFINLV